MENLRMYRITKKIDSDYNRFGFVYLGKVDVNTITLIKFTDLKKAKTALFINSDYIFVQISTARKLGVVEI